LRVKHRQAELVLDYLDLSAHSPKKSAEKMRPFKNRYAEIWAELKRLNRRGKGAVDGYV
jgi:hypothetical protein